MTNLPELFQARTKRACGFSYKLAGASTYGMDTALPGQLDIDEICNAFSVPVDYASGGVFVFRLIQDAATVTNIESVECRISVDGAAIGAADEDNLADSAAVQSVTSAPTGTWAVGASIGIACKQGNATPDDIVYFLGAEGRYTATQ